MVVFSHQNQEREISLVSAVSRVKGNGAGLILILCLLPNIGFSQPRVSIEVTPPPAPESTQKDISEIQKHRATYERGRNLLTAPALTSPPPEQTDPQVERRDALMERRQEYKEGKIATQEDRREKIDAIKKKLEGDAEKIRKAEEERLKKRQQKIIEEAQAEREQKELAQEKRHNDIMSRAREHRKRMAVRKKQYNERKALAESRTRWKPRRPETLEPRTQPQTPLAETPAQPSPEPEVGFTPTPGIDINIRPTE